MMYKFTDFDLFCLNGGWGNLEQIVDGICSKLKLSMLEKRDVGFTKYKV